MDFYVIGTYVFNLCYNAASYRDVLLKAVKYNKWIKSDEEKYKVICNQWNCIYFLYALFNKM